MMKQVSSQFPPKQFGHSALPPPKMDTSGQDSCANDAAHSDHADEELMMMMMKLMMMKLKLTRHHFLSPLLHEQQSFAPISSQLRRF